MQRGASYPQTPQQHYRTPRAPIMTFFQTFNITSRVCDPCAGTGAILEIAKQFGKETCGYDIQPWGNQFPYLDFLRDPFPEQHVFFLTNPPFGPNGRLGVKFAERMLELTEPWNTGFALLLPVDFDSGKTRRHLFRDCPAFIGTLKLYDRIVWFPEQAEATGQGPASNHAWFVWDWVGSGFDAPLIWYPNDVF